MVAIITQAIQTTSQSTDSSTGSLALDNNSTFQHIINGSAPGFALSLPNIPTIENGQQYQFLNNTPNDITIKDFSGASIFTVNAGLMGYASNNAGSWIVRQESISPSSSFNEDVIITNHNGEVMVNHEGFVLRSH